VRIGFVKPVAQPRPDGGPDRSGALVAAVTTHSPVQLATVAPGAVTPAPRPPAGGLRPRVATVTVAGAGRVVVTGRSRDPEADLVQRATALVAVGQGVHPALYGELDPLLGLLGAELVGTRKVTDRGWLPKTRQIGVTGSAVRPVLYVAIGLSGSVNHMVGVRRARAVLALNSDPSAPVFDGADIGVTGDWRRVVPLLAAELAAWLAARGNLSNPALTTGPAGFTIEN
jgi:electron transfer flavoprotein alpha subunit